MTVPGTVLSFFATLVFGTEIWLTWISGMQNLLAVAAQRGALNLSISPMTYSRSLGIMALTLALVALYKCRDLPKSHRAAAVIAASLFAAPYALSYDLAPLAVFASVPILRRSNWQSFGAALCYSAALGPLSLVAIWPALKTGEQH